jgi:hypothetical protein
MLTFGKALRRWIIAVLALTVSHAVRAESPSQLSVGQLLAEGWEVAGYAASPTMIGSVILFKHKDRNYFVQCSAVYDATRSQRAAERVVTNCYEIR